MAKNISVCLQCGYSGVETGQCPQCHGELIQTTYTDIYWSRCDEEKRKQLIKLYYEKIPEGKLEKDKEYRDKIDNLILTTCSSVDGYRAIAQHGLVFGETIIRSSFSNSLKAGFADFFSGMEFGDTEMEGTLMLMDNARKYAIKKMKDEAIKRGANAIIGVDAESVISEANLIHITIYGTAVELAPIEE